jgi:hypothetical protein
LKRRLGLVFGAIDMRQTPQGDYVFLEINPAGQFMYIEAATGLPLAKAMAEELHRLDRRVGEEKGNRRFPSGMTNRKSNDNRNGEGNGDGNDKSDGEGNDNRRFPSGMTNRNGNRNGNGEGNGEGNGNREDNGNLNRNGGFPSGMTVKRTRGRGKDKR